MPWFLYALFAALCITAVGLLQKKSLQQERSLEYVTLLNVAKLLVFVTAFSQVLELRVTSGQFVIIGISGFIGGCSLLFTARAMRALELSSVLPILALDPALVALFAFMLLGERLTLVKIGGLLLAVIGTFILEFHRTGSSGLFSFLRSPKSLLEPFRSIGRGPGGRSLVIAVISLALSATLDRLMLVRVPVTTYLFYSYLCGTILYLVLLAGSGTKIGMPSVGKGSFIGIILLTAAINVIGNAAQARAVSVAAASLVIAVKRVSVLFDVILAGKFFHEKNILQKAVASIIILAGIYFIIVP